MDQNRVAGGRGVRKRRVSEVVTSQSRNTFLSPLATPLDTRRTAPMRVPASRARRVLRSRGHPRLAVCKASLDCRTIDESWPITLRGVLDRWRRLTRVVEGKFLGVRQFKSQGSRVYTQEVCGKEVARQQLEDWVGPGFGVAGSTGSNHLQCIWNTAATVTPWHVDDTHGLLLCLRGVKTVTFLPNTVHDTKTPVPMEEARRGVKHRPLSRLPPQVYRLTRGEYLVIPKYYWHSVHSSEGSLAVSYAVTSPGRWNYANAIGWSG